MRVASLSLVKKHQQVLICPIAGRERGPGQEGAGFDLDSLGLQGRQLALAKGNQGRVAFHVPNIEAAVNPFLKLRWVVEAEMNQVVFNRGKSLRGSRKPG
jgi:hypothetical protein